MSAANKINFPVQIAKQRKAANKSLSVAVLELAKDVPCFDTAAYHLQTATDRLNLVHMMIEAAEYKEIATNFKRDAKAIILTQKNEAKAAKAAAAGGSK
jgi:hypothetical protein